MTANRIIHHIFNQPDLHQVDQASLEQLVEKYPYFAAARLLLAQKQFAGNKDLTAPALQQAQLYGHSPQHIFQFVTTPLEAAPMPEEWNGNLSAPPPGVTAGDKAIADELNVNLSAPLVEDKAIADEMNVSASTSMPEVTVEDKAIAEELNVSLSAPEQISDEDAAILAELEAEDARNEAIRTATAQAAQHAAPEEDDEDRAIAAKYDEFLYDRKEPVVPASAAPAEAPDEIVAIDYEAERETVAFEAERRSDAPDEVVAVDYEAEQATAEFEAARLGAPDEIVAIDYGEMLAEEKEAPHYEAEIEEEDIFVDASASGEGLAIPAAAPVVTAAVEEEGPDLPGETAEETEETAPIRIFPMDTPPEEQTLTFQPLYTEDYFAYKKLKDPNSAETMTDKAAAEMRSFTDWLRELKDNFAGKSAKDWYHQQLNKIYEDDEPEVSERVEKMAMDSITLQEDDIVSETLAEIWARQHQHGKAIAIYQKLSLLNPDKNAYFAQKIKDLQLLTDNNK
ncbi:hypothetical protein ACWKWU_02265 [Chitinophaga lutea]